jgi:hypothetical protein
MRAFFTPTLVIDPPKLAEEPKADDAHYESSELTTMDDTIYFHAETFTYI